MPEYLYPGQELAVFEKAVNWKNYLANKISPYLQEKVLEVGAGIGSTTLQLNRNNIREWVLLEPDFQNQEILKDKLEKKILPPNCRIVAGGIDNVEKEDQFGTILYIDVLEHIKNDKEELLNAAMRLKEGGFLIILSPAYQSLFSPFDRAIGHFRRYTKNSLLNVVPPGLKLETLQYLDSTGFFASVANKLLLKQKYPTEGQVNMWDKWMIPVSKFTDPLFFYSFGKSILGIWKKQ